VGSLQALFAQNRVWADSMLRDDPSFFEKLSYRQRPDCLWIGCSDSRVPANQIVGLMPGDIFVHRNVANVVVHTDLNCLSVIQYAVDVLHVRHVIVCGHYGCGGVAAALRDERLGLIDNWLRHVQDVAEKHAEQLGELVGNEERQRRLCELNVIEQALNVRQTTIVEDAWRRGHRVTLHGWIYGIEDGLLRDLELSADDGARFDELYAAAVAKART
jgi:carbonic anhydrase